MLRKHWMALILWSLVVAGGCSEGGEVCPVAPKRVHFDFRDSAQGWVADRREDSSSQGIRAVRPAVWDGKPCLELDVDLDASDPNRVSGEALAVLYGDISSIRLEVFVPEIACDSEAPPGVQVLLHDTSGEERSWYSAWQNIGERDRLYYPLQIGEWNTVRVRPEKGDLEGTIDDRVDPDFDPRRCMIVGVKIGLGDGHAPEAKLKGTFAIRDVVVDRRLARKKPGRFVDFAAQEKDLRDWRRTVEPPGGAAAPAGALPGMPERGPLGPGRPYFFTDPGWEAGAWSNKDISIVSHQGKKLLAIKANFDEEAGGAREGYVALRFVPNLNLDLQAVEDSTISLDAWFEPDKGTSEPRGLPGPFELEMRLCLYSASSGLGPDKAWQFSQAYHVGGMGRAEGELTPEIGYVGPEALGPGPVTAEGELAYGPWENRANKAILYVGLSVVASEPWKGTLYIDNVRLGGEPRHLPVNVSDFVRARLEGFVLESKPFEVRGVNVSFLPQKSAYIVERTLWEIARRGMTTVRAWGFSDGLGRHGLGNNGYALQPAAGVYDEQSFRQLDYFVAMAQKQGLRVILPLVNFWSDRQGRGIFDSQYGGIGVYLGWAGIGLERDEDGWLTNHHLFFTDPECKRLFKEYLRYVTSRVNVFTGHSYAQSPGLFAWELINEPRTMPPLPLGKGGEAERQRWLGLARQRADEFHAWAAEMSAFLKNSCGVRQMVAIGDEGYLFRPDGQDQYHDGRYGMDWEKLLTLGSIDFGCVHLYPVDWGFDEAQCAQWIREHAAAARQAKKPVLFEEWALADFSPRPRETDEQKVQRERAAYTALEWYRQEHGGSRAEADRDFASFHPTHRALAEGAEPEDAGRATETRTQRRRELYGRWIELIEGEGAGWLMWQVSGPQNNDQPVWPPRDCDWMSLGVGYGPHEAILDGVAAR